MSGAGAASRLSLVDRLADRRCRVFTEISTTNNGVQMMFRSLTRTFPLALAGLLVAPLAPAQNAGDGRFMPGEPLEQSANVRTYGSFRFAESISYDEERDLYVVVNAGIAQDVIPNDGYVSLVNPDGTVHTLKWIGVNRNGLTLNHPLGSDIANGLLFVADINVIRWFDMRTGFPAGSVEVEGATFINDIEVDDDGVIWATQTREPFRLYRIEDGDTEVVVEGEPLNLPNGVAFDNDGDIVVVNIGDNNVLTFTPRGRLRDTEQAVDAGNDGLVVTEDGTKFVSSVRQGTVSRIRPGEPAEIIAYGIPSAASMAYDSKRHRLLIPMNDWNAISFVDID
jgi:sugar lactone lactonase YvrE